MWRKGNFCALLVRNSTEVSQKSKIKLPYDPAFLLRVFNLKKLKIVSQRYKRISMFVVALFIIAKIHKQPKCPLIDEWVKKTWCKLSAFRVSLFTCEKERNLVIWDNTEGTWGHHAKWSMLGREKEISYGFTYMWNLKTKTIQNWAYRYREQIGGCQGWWRVGKTSQGHLKIQIFHYKINKSWGYNVQHGDHS